MDTLNAWVITANAPGIGPRRFQQLLSKLSQHHLSLEKFLTLPAKEQYFLFPFPTLYEQWASHCRTFPIDAVMHDLAEKSARVVTLHSPEYPLLLKEIPDPPPILFVKGNLEKVNHRPIAMVGARRMSTYGRRVTQLLTRSLVEFGFTIVSGFMYGVDAEAHRTCLAAGGYTVGVLGYGFNFVYPSQQSVLMEEVLANGGAFITEFLPTQNPIPSNFPVRNRIVAGLSLGVVVAEAAAKSGSKITAQYAVDYGREVFSVPAPLTSDFCEGTKELINDGATLVTSIEDILCGLGMKVEGVPSQSTVQKYLAQCSDPQQQLIIELLHEEELAADELIEKTGLSVEELQTQLTQLEIKHFLVFAQGKYSLQ